MFGIGFVCLSDLCLALGLSVGWTYVWHWVCLFVRLVFGIGFVCLSDLCLALCLFVILIFENGWVIWNKHS